MEANADLHYCHTKNVFKNTMPNNESIRIDLRCIQFAFTHIIITFNGIPRWAGQAMHRLGGVVIDNS
ncbi:hypothetical protein SAMN04488505_102980 [Chitinophaga rupis]|uniref:Uncharacterized protein n=1 Tax=Chitinophaga rupis TaxID=573321 RepID=A0A1H7SPM8_9BACT|nr:hypothetical protein SAMN04488505_102980 [Chitinophaga rupis]